MSNGNSKTNNTAFNFPIEEYEDVYADNESVTIDLSTSTMSPTEGSYSVTDFENDAQVNQAFEEVTDYLAQNRGLGSVVIDQATIGKQDDIAEFMRDDVARFGAPLAKANILKDAPEEVKAAYRLLQDRFEVSSLTGVGEKLEAVKDYTIDTIFNPEMLATGAAILAAPLTGGTSIAARIGTGAVAKKKGKDYLKDAISATRASATKNPLGYSATIGGLYGGAGSLVAQDLDVSLDKREGYSLGETAVGVGAGALFGTGLYGVGKYASKYFAKGSDISDDISPTPEMFDEGIAGEYIPASGGKIIEDLDRLLAGDTVNIKNINDLNIDQFVSDIGGGEKTKEEILDAIRAAANSEATADEIKNQFKQTAFKAYANLTGNLFGKAAGTLSPLTKVSGTAKILQQKLSYEFGIGLKTNTKIVEKDLSEVQREITGRYSEKFRSIVEDISLHAVKGTLAEDVNNMLMLALRSNKPVVNEKLEAGTMKAINKAALGIRELYKEMGVSLKEINVIDDLVDNYFPRMWDRKAIEANPEKLAELLETKGGYAKGTGKDTVDDMLSIKDQIDSGGTGGHFFSAKRKLNQIENDADFQEFLNDDVLGSLNAYTFQAGKSIAKHRVLGVNNLKDFRKFWTARIQKEMSEKGQRLTQAEANQIDLLYKTATGEGMERFGKGVQTAVDVYGFTNRVALLGLATLSSLTEVFINVGKAGVRNSVKGFGEALEVSFKGITKDLENNLKTNHGLTAKEAFSEMRKYSIAMDQAMAQQGNRLAGDDLVNDWLQDKSNKFFRLTLLDQWTKFVQTASYASGKNLINENLAALAANGNQKMSRRLETMAGELAELGIDYKQGVQWFKNGAKKDEAFYDQQVLGGAARYSNSVVLQPTAMSGLKPLLHSNPKTGIAFQLLGYPVAFTNTVLKGAAKAMIKDPVRNVPKTIAAGLIMTNMARWTNYVRSDGTNEEGKDTSKIYAEAVARWGGNGILLDSLQRARTSSKYTKSALPYAALPVGPVGSDAIKLLQQGIVPTVGGKVPLLNGTYFGKNILGEDTVGKYKDVLREIEKDYVSGALIVEFDEPTAKIGYNKGGEVLVPNAPTEPDERIDKMTGQPYNVQAGSAFMDTTDPFKVLMSKGGKATRAKYSVGRLVSGAIAKKAVEFTTETASKLSKNVDDLFNRDTVQNAANNIDRQAKNLKIDVTDPKVQEYIDGVVVNNLEPDSYKSIFELEDLPEWRSAVNNSDSNLQEEMWSKAQQSLGFSDRKLKALKIVKDAQDDVDPVAALESTIPNSLGKLTTEYNRVRVDVSAEELSKIDMSKFNEEILNNVEDFLGRRIVESDTQSLSPEGLQSVVEKNIAKLIASGEVDFTKFNAPKLDFQPALPGAPLTRKSVEEKIKNSIEKNLVYRGITSYNTAQHDVSFAFPREIGAHVGTRGQATTILIRGLPNTALKQELKSKIDSKDLSQEELSLLFSDPDLIEGNFIPEITEATQIVDDVPMDSGYFGTYADEIDTDIKPLTMTQGYISVENPLYIESDLAGWEAERILTGSEFDEYFITRFEKDGVDFNEDVLEELTYRAQEVMDTSYKDVGITTETVRPLKVSEALKQDLMRAELNIDFRNFLKDLGYDSIAYKNEVEMSLKGEDDLSYILFDPDQFITVTSRLVEDTKASFASGGSVSPYKIQAGDTLTSIARQHGTTVEQLAADNEIADPNMIYAGSNIDVPAAGSLQKTSLQEAPTQLFTEEPTVQEAPSELFTEKTEPTLDMQLKEAYSKAEQAVTSTVKEVTEDVASAVTESIDNVTGIASNLSNQTEEVLSSGSKKLKETAEDISKGTNKALKTLKRLVSIDADKLRDAVSSPEVDISDVKIPDVDFSSEGRTAENTFGATDKPSSVPIPTMIKQFLHDVTGGDKKLTEKDLLAPELEFLTARAIALNKKEKNKFEYEDYNTQKEGQSQYSDVGGGGGVIDFFTKLNDPAYSMKTTLGQAEIKVNEQGETVIVDRYNFNDSDGAFNLLQFLKGVKNAGFSPYAQARNIAREFGSKEGEGSEVEINLGKLNKKESKELLASL